MIERGLIAESKEDLYKAIDKSGDSLFERRLIMFYSLSRFLRTENPLNPDGMMRVGEILHMIRNASKKGAYSKEELLLILDAMVWARTNETVEDGFDILKDETDTGPSKEQFLKEADPEIYGGWIKKWRSDIELLLSPK